MTIPDKLITVAIEAGNEAIGEYLNGASFPDGIHAEVCRRAVAAVLDTIPIWPTEVVGPKDRPSWADGWNDLARTLKGEPMGESNAHP